MVVAITVPVPPELASPAMPAIARSVRLVHGDPVSLSRAIASRVKASSTTALGPDTEFASGGGAVGGAFAVGVSDQTTRAYIKNGQADVSGNIGVKADADTRFWNVAVSGAAGSGAPVGC